MKSTKKTYVKLMLGLVVLIIGSLYSLNDGAYAQSQFTPHSSRYEVEYKDDFTGFETHLETIRQTLKIPGMSAAVLRDQQLIWASGFGYADLENQIPATSETPYGLASVTKPVAAVLIMQLVEEGLVDLDAPVSQYGVDLLGEIVTVRHLMTHTSDGVPGSEHHYNGSRYGQLGGVIEGATGKTFAENLSERFLLPLEMQSTALNPINFWGGSNPTGIRDILPALGWGPNFRHYPQVYAQLTRPYQFDAGYNLVPGMYHLHHNPGAGLISTVTDLAKFDIALDQGLLLDEVTKAEMFSPAYSTYQNRDDLMYGLGWYVQDFDDLQLLWHTGRWHPSTSALYLKIPEENLTFIVLANTAQLTTPFDGIGRGDISKSLLALSFYRHFVFAAKYGSELPIIDWGAAQGVLVEQLSEIEDHTARNALERELWAFRQAYASVGRANQAEKLLRVNLRAFPDSSMRKDELFTKTVGSFPLVRPALSATAFTRLSRGVILWFMLVFISLAWVLAWLMRTGQLRSRLTIYWLLATVFLGPVAVLVYTRTHTPAERAGSKHAGAAILSAFLAGIYAIGWALAFSLLVRLGSQPHPLAILGITYLTPLLVCLVFFRIPILLPLGVEGFKARLSGELWAAFISMNIAFAVMFSLTMVLDQFLSTIPGSSNPFYWAVLSFISIANLAGQYAIHIWMMSRGFSNRQPGRPPEQESAPPASRKSAWPVGVTSLLIMIASLAITIINFT